MTNSTPHSLLFAQQPLTHERSSSPKLTLRPTAQPSSPHLRAGLCQSSPLPSKGTQIPTGVFLLPIHSGDGVVAVCILIITILNGVGGAGAVCGRSRGQLGLLYLVSPQGCSEQQACELGQSRYLPEHLSIDFPPALTSPHHPIPSQAGANNSMQ